MKDAAAAQNAYETELAELQKTAANQAAFEALTEIINSLQQKLNDANYEIITLGHNIYRDFAPRIKNIQSMINDLRTELQKLYDAIELNEDSVLDAERVKVIEASIQSLLDDARKEATGIKELSDIQSESLPCIFDGNTLLFPALRANSTVSLYSLNGTLIFNKTVRTAGEYSFPLSGLNAGVYVVTVNGLTYKIVKR